MLHSVGLDALATANDMNRNVLCTSNPYESQLHAEGLRVGEKDLRASAAAYPRLCRDLAGSEKGRHYRRRADPRPDLSAA
ncbi:hypothetical protein LNP24_03015 [Klebsiella pneumoniae subsp. pneumoniae]|nr:hypothetical protein [Klebsiella pneumoniae subsp. pneumoniae]